MAFSNCCPGAPKHDSVANSFQLSDDNRVIDTIWSQYLSLTEKLPSSPPLSASHSMYSNSRETSPNIYLPSNRRNLSLGSSNGSSDANSETSHVQNITSAQKQELQREISLFMINNLNGTLLHNPARVSPPELTSINKQKISSWMLNNSRYQVPANTSSNDISIDASLGSSTSKLGLPTEEFSSGFCSSGNRLSDNPSQRFLHNFTSNVKENSHGIETLPNSFSRVLPSDLRSTSPKTRKLVSPDIHLDSSYNNSARCSSSSSSTSSDMKSMLNHPIDISPSGIASGMPHIPSKEQNFPKSTDDSNSNFPPSREIIPENVEKMNIILEYIWNECIKLEDSQVNEMAAELKRLESFHQPLLYLPNKDISLATFKSLGTINKQFDMMLECIRDLKMFVESFYFLVNNDESFLASPLN